MQRRFRQSPVDVGRASGSGGKDAADYDKVLMGEKHLCPRRVVIAAGVYFSVGLGPLASEAKSNTRLLRIPV